MDYLSRNALTVAAAVGNIPFFSTAMASISALITPALGAVGGAVGFGGAQALTTGVYHLLDCLFQHHTHTYT
jgi:hypothetical protein